MAYAMDFLKWSKKSINVEHQTAMKSYYMLLYLGSHSYYTSIETWPTEAEFNQFIRVIAECPMEESLINALIEDWSEMLGGTPEERKASHANVILAADLISILETLTKRCLSVRGFDNDGNSLLLVRNPLTIERLFNVIKENIAADKKKQLQREFSNKNLYWRVWFLTVAWSCLNHTTLLKLLYDKYALLQMMVSMALTKDYNFPPPLVDAKQVEQIAAEDKLEQQLEQQILKNCDFNVDEETDFSYCFNDPGGKLRKPANIFTDQLRICNDQFDLRSVLLSIENPDLLDKLNQEQGVVRSMPVIVQMLLANSSQTIHRIPLQSLCQLVVFQRLRNILLDSSKSEEENVRIAIKYLLASLAAPVLTEREASFATLQRLLSPTTEDMEIDFSLDLLINISHFAKLSSEICEELSKCCLIENDKERLVQYIKFITAHATNSNNQDLLNKIAFNLSNLVRRVSEDSANNNLVSDCLIGFYASFIQQLCNISTASSNFVDDTCSEMLHVSISGSVKMEFNISAQILETILELLCETFGSSVKSNCESREYLIKIFFPISVSKNTLYVTKANDPKIVVDILPKKLKMKMLSAHDERVVKIALEGVNAEQALDFIQSFALSTFSCTHLLTIINESELGKSQAAKPAIPFVKAYKKKGAKGADQFLNAMQNAQWSVAAELMDEKKAKVFENTNHIAEYFNSLLAGTPDHCSVIISSSYSNLISSLKSNDEFVKFTLSFIAPRIAQFAQLPSVLSPLVLVFMGAAAKNNSLHAQLRTLKDRAEKCGPAKFIANMLYSFHPKPNKHSQQSKAVIKPIFSFDQMQADEIVRVLVDASAKNLTDMQISGMLEKLQILRPEIVDASSADFTEQVSVLFSSNSAPILNLISQITVCASVSTLRKVMATLLIAFDCKLLPSSVLNFVVLLDFCIADLVSNQQQEQWQDSVDKLLQILKCLIEHHSGILALVKAKLQLMSAQHEYIMSEESKKKFKAVQFIADSINCSYPGVSKKWSIYKIGLNVDTLPITEIDDMLHKSISEMFTMITSNDKNTEELVAQAMTNLLTEAKCRPKVIARQIPLLSVYITNIVQMNTRNMRDTSLFKLLEVTLDVIIQSAPYSFADPTSIQFTLQSYFNFLRAMLGAQQECGVS
uniref:Uncharacterized protein n=1 Tax=Ditylenchus dipsaci TaxID=166011 RepID=A0A915ENQ0_9BILA